MDVCIDFLGEARILFTFNANSDYLQLEMDEKDADQTAFVTHHGLYWYTKMPFGPKNASKTFQGAMNVILASVERQCAIVYINDVIIFFKSLGEHVTHIEEVLRLLKAWQ